MNAESCCFINCGLFVPGADLRWRWIPLIFGVVLLLCLTVLMVYLTRNFVKSEFAVFLLQLCKNAGMKPFKETCQYRPIRGMSSVWCILQNGCGDGIVGDL